METNSECEKLCVLLVDEMQLRTRIEFDKGLQQIVGYVSPETIPAGSAQVADKDVASHALVFMLRGLTSSWKQTVAYVFTGASLKKEPYWEFTKEVIAACEQAGFKIQCVTSDMGPVNTGLWRHVGIHSGRSHITTSIPHPFEPDRPLYFVADPPHLLKNLWNCVLTNGISLNPDIVTKYNLPSDVVSGDYVKQLLEMQQGRELRLAYKLKTSHVNPTQYEKMRVCLAAQFFSRSTAAAIQTCVNLELMPVDALTTAWFLNMVNDWFDAMNSKHKDSALLNGRHTAKNQALTDMLAIVKDLSFNGRKVWKPVQTGIQLSTIAAMQLGEKLMTAYNLPYFMTGRLSQDPVENLFSQSRGQGVMHPSCTLFRQALRLITIAQYLEVSKNASYEEDKCSYLIDYLSHKADTLTSQDDCILPVLLSPTADDGQYSIDNSSQLPSLAADWQQYSTDNSAQLPSLAADWQGQYSTDNASQLPSLAADWQQYSTDNASQLPSLAADWQGQYSTDNSSQLPLESHPSSLPVGTTVRSRSSDIDELLNPGLGGLQGNALYDIIGWALSRFFATVKCKSCQMALISDGISDPDFGLFTSARSHGGLTHPTSQVMQAVKLAESVFAASKPSLHKMTDIVQQLTQQVLDVIDASGFEFPTCHNALPRIMKKYIRLRVNEYATNVTKTKALAKKQFGSKTACRLTVIM